MLDAAVIRELHGGHQARVFGVTRRNGETIIAKVTDASMVDRAIFATRVDVVAALGELDHRVCRPLPNDDQLVTEVAFDGERGLLVCYEHADGDPVGAADGGLMGRTLAGLHQSMARLPRAGLPSVAALRGSTTGLDQLLHGDFNAGNLRQRDGAVRVFDLDDCGYGPVEFDVANALYMVLFDTLTSSAPNIYGTFREAFVGGYRAATAGDLAADVLDGLIDRRVDALRDWLGDLEQAPIGIRTATPEWRATLQTFVVRYQALR